MGPEFEMDCFFSLLDSLDRAFGADQGLEPVEDHEWGRRFFNHLAAKDAGTNPSKTLVFATARRLLYLFALREYESGLCMHIYHRPEYFLRTVLMLLKHDSASGANLPEESSGFGINN